MQESVSDFKARIALLTRERETGKKRERRAAVYRPKRVSGFYPTPAMNADPTKPNT